MSDEVKVTNLYTSYLVIVARFGEAHPDVIDALDRPEHPKHREALARWESFIQTVGKDVSGPSFPVRQVAVIDRKFWGEDFGSPERDIKPKEATP